MRFSFPLRELLPLVDDSAADFAKKSYPWPEKPSAQLLSPELSLARQTAQPSMWLLGPRTPQAVASAQNVGPKHQLHPFGMMKPVPGTWHLGRCVSLLRGKSANDNIFFKKKNTTNTRNNVPKRIRSLSARPSPAWFSVWWISDEHPRHIVSSGADQKDPSSLLAESI